MQYLSFDNLFYLQVHFHIIFDPGFILKQKHEVTPEMDACFFREFQSARMISENVQNNHSQI